MGTNQAMIRAVKQLKMTQCKITQFILILVKMTQIKTNKELPQTLLTHPLTKET